MHTTKGILVIKMQQSSDQTIIVLGTAIVEQDFASDNSVPQKGQAS